MKAINTLADRNSLGWWLNDAGLIGSGVEIGCAEGKYSSVILRSWKGERLFMVDPWLNLPRSEYPQPHVQVDFEKWYQSCVDLSTSDPRAKLVRLRSVDAAKQIEDRSLDFVYIDAAHDYRNVMQDMDTWFPKVKPGGLFAGHDFSDRDPREACNEVVPAVMRWMREHGLTFTVTPCTSWWAVK